MEGGVRVPAAYYYPSCIRTGCERQGSRLASVASSLRATFVAFFSASFSQISALQMSFNEHDRVLEALDVLCNVSKETLRSLRTQVPLAFQKLQALVANSSHPQDTNRFSPSLETQSLPIPCSHSQTSTSDVSNVTDTSSATLGAQDSISSIHLSSSPSSADGHPLPNSI